MACHPPRPPRRPHDSNAFLSLVIACRFTAEDTEERGGMLNVGAERGREMGRRGDTEIGTEHGNFPGSCLRDGICAGGLAAAPTLCPGARRGDMARRPRLNNANRSRRRSDVAAAQIAELRRSEKP